MCIVCLNQMALQGEIDSQANADDTETESAALNGDGFVLTSSNNYDAIKWGDDELRTDGGRVTWSRSVLNIPFTAQRTEALYIDAARAAFDAWEAVANIDFEYVEGDADIDVETATAAQVPNLAGPTVGLASYSFSGGNAPIRSFSSATIYMDLDVNWSPTGNGGTSYYAVLLHEIGHAIGLAHIVDSSQIMNSNVSARDLGAGDIAGARALYGDVRFSDGDDIVSFASETSGQFAELGAGDDDMTGSAFADTVYGGAGNDTVNAGAGRDVLIDALGRNELNGEEGDDFIFSSGDTTSGGEGTAFGGEDHDIMLGGAGDDRLDGGSGDDTLVGDATNGFFHGDDVLFAGSGTDFLEGGGGRDVFVFRPNQGTNTIAELSFNVNDPTATQVIGVDFTSGVDKIDLVGFGLSNAAAYNAVTDVGGVAQFEANGTIIIFHDLLKADLDQGDFM